MINYLVHIVIFQLIFLVVYDLFLRKETFHAYNRFYLLFTSLLSLILPFIKFNWLTTVVPNELFIQLPTIILGQENITESTLSQMSSKTFIHQDLFSWSIIWYLGIAVACMILIVKLVKLYSVYRESMRSTEEGKCIVILNNSQDAFSFFNIIFLGEQINGTMKDSIIAHERIHIEQGHSYDIIYFEILRILFWMNPLVYFYQQRIEELHEYIADEAVIQTVDKKPYFNDLLKKTLYTDINLVNHFNKNSLIKKRIIMLNKVKSSNKSLLKYFLLLPLLAGIILYNSCESEQNFSQEDVSLELERKIDDVRLRLENKENLSDSEKEKLQLLFKEMTKNQGLTSFSSSNNSSVTQAKGFSTIDDDIEVPFAVIEHVPLFKGCKDDSDSDNNKMCTTNMISSFVAENFNIELAKELGLTGRQRINVIFKIDQNGDVIDIRARAPHKALAEEAMRVVSIMPQFTPGRQNGHTVTVPYSLPIVFEVNE